MKIPTFPPARVSGAALRAIAAVSDNAAAARGLRMMFAAQLDIDAIAKLDETDRGQLPWDARPLAARPPRQSSAARHEAPPVPGSWPRTSAGYSARFLDGRSSPRAATESALAEARKLADRAHPPSGGPLLDFADATALRDADASTSRYQAHAPLGPLDGVPIVIKEETAVAGLPCRAGTRIFPATPSPADATVVARLRAAGAIILGSSSMTELGLSPFGVNPHRAMPRNPHEADHLAGGSSTGSAVAVATGLCPVALAADGGGSIRIPSSLCGVFGLKPTFGRVSRVGDFYRGTMNHLGPIGASTRDLAIFLETCAGSDDGDSSTLGAPPLANSLTAALTRGVSGMRIGVLESAWNDAVPSVANAGRVALAALERAGAVLVPVSLRLAHVAAPIGYLTIGLEELADMLVARRERRSEIGADTLVSLAALSDFGSADYLDAQRIRVRLREETRDAFLSVDLLALPASTIPAPPITDSESQSGILDAAALHGVCRTMFLGNLTGLPASSSPVGRDEAGLPLGLQLMGDAWDEATVLAAMAELERSGAATVQMPRVRAGDPPGW